MAIGQVDSRTILSDTSKVADQRHQVKLFGVTFDALTFDQAVHALIELSQGDQPRYAVTANVDHVVRLHRRPELQPLYDNADLTVADGMPLIWASKRLNRPLPERVAGSDLFPALCQQAAFHGLSVFLLGGDPGTADAAAEVMRKRHPSLKVAGTYCPDFGFERDPDQCRAAVDAVRQAAPDILFVGLGSPKQEQWIADHCHEYGAKLSIGVGISFSFACGHVVRAPRWMQRAGLEWLHRLAQEPRRLARRYLIDDAVFLRLFLREWRLARRQRRTGSFIETKHRTHGIDLD
jgi:N-acetylglucosaminyldiphosphoundecaprenol N-acetyl-beta-D-mannosaminyltransferase